MREIQHFSCACPSVIVFQPENFSGVLKSRNKVTLIYITVLVGIELDGY